MLTNLMFVIVVLSASLLVSKTVRVRGVRSKYIAVGFALFIFANVLVLHVAFGLIDDWTRAQQQQDQTPPAWLMAMDLMSGSSSSTIDSQIQSLFDQYRSMHNQLHPR